MRRASLSESRIIKSKMEVTAAIIGRGRSASEHHIPAYERIPDAQVVATAYDGLDEVGDMKTAREKGLFRLEGKEYVINDGDIVKFRFSV